MYGICQEIVVVVALGGGGPTRGRLHWWHTSADGHGSSDGYNVRVCVYGNLENGKFKATLKTTFTCSHEDY